MKIKFEELKFSIKPNVDKSYPDLFARVSISFFDEHQRNFTFNGFTIRKSKNDGKPYLTHPSKPTNNGFYVFSLVDKTLFKEIEREVLKEYSDNTIPIIDEEKYNSL